MGLAEFDRRLIDATQSGLPLVARPFEAIGAVLGVSSDAVRERFTLLLDNGLVRRIGAVPDPYRLGFVADGMTVWDVLDARVDELGARVGELPGVSRCCRCSRELPRWPYNLFAILHGRSRREVERRRVAVRALLGDACRADTVLYSGETLKQTGSRPCAE